jgi:hypothetical protein
MILLISASWVARIIGMSHQHPALFSFLRKDLTTQPRLGLEQFRSIT